MLVSALKAVLKFVQTFMVGALVGGTFVFMGAFLFWSFFHSSAPSKNRLPDPPALIEKVREIARLETLEVKVHKKVTFAVDPPKSDNMVVAIVNWAAWTANPPEGKAMVFADVRVGFDMRAFDESSLRVNEDVVEVILPTLTTTVELRPGETEVIVSNLDSQQTAHLLEEAKWAIHREVENDEALRQRAEESARRALGDFLKASGFREVRFVDVLAPLPAPTSASQS